MLNFSLVFLRCCRGILLYVSARGRFDLPYRLDRSNRSRPISDAYGKKLIKFIIHSMVLIVLEKSAYLLRLVEDTLEWNGDLDRFELSSQRSLPFEV